MNESDIIKEVRWRFRICNYLIRLGFAWFAVGVILSLIPNQPELGWIATVIEIAGGGIFSAAFVLTFAIYRCPICDRYLSRFRPRKDQCQRCGATIR